MSFFPIKLNKKQMIAQRALDSTRFIVIGYGGAKKGGKSYWGRGAILRRALQYPGTKHLITRRSYGEVNKNHRAEIVKLCRRWGVRYRWDHDLNAFFFPEYTHEGEPSALYLGYCETISDAERYQGIEWLTIWHEECTQVAWDVLQYVNNELAVPVHAAAWGAIAKIIYTCNPVGISKRAIKANVRDPGMKRQDGIIWIQANWEDNKTFAKANPNFAKNLIRTNKKSPWLAKALLDGDWNADPDTYFSSFDEDTHSPTCHIRDYKIPYYAKWYCGLDAGSNPSAFAAIYIAKWKDKQNSFNPYTEKWEQRQHWHAVDEVILWDTDPDEQAQICKEKEKELAHSDMLHNVVRICDPAAATENLAKESQEATRTVLNIWGKHGLSAIPAERRGKLTGLNIIRSLQRKGIASYSPRCQKLIQEITDAVHEKTSTGEVGTLPNPKQPDDATDGYRYPTAEIYETEFAEAPGGVFEGDLWEEIEA